jgi:hypothetical protein
MYMKDSNLCGENKTELRWDQNIVYSINKDTIDRLHRPFSI